MNWLDITILCLCGVGLIKGLFDGMIIQVVALGALIIGFYLCSGAAGWLCGYLQQVSWFPPNAVFPLSYFLGFILIVGIILLAGNIVNHLISATPLSILNHLFGGFVGLVIMILVISFLFNMMEIIGNLSSLIPQEIKVESRFYNMIKDVIPTIFPGNLFGLNFELPV